MADRFRIGTWWVDPDLGTVSDGEARSTRLEPKVMDVCVYLAERAGRLVSKEQLIQAVWQGTFVGDDVLVRCISELRRALDDDVRQPQFIETLPKRGYRLIAPVTATVSPPVQRPVARRRATAGAALALVILVAVAAAVWPRKGPSEAHPTARIESLAVLPFENLSGDPGQEYVADGMTDAAITALGQVSALRVTGRQSIAQFKHSSLPVREIAARLKVDALVEGSIARDGEHFAISVRLIDGRSESLLWSKRYDGVLGDLLPILNAISGSVVEEIRIKVAPEERARLVTPTRAEPRAYALFLKGRYYWEKRTEEGLKHSRSYFEQAIAVDPEYAPAHVGLAEALLLLAEFAVLPPADTMPAARTAARQAIALDERFADAHAVLGTIMHRLEWDFEAGERELRLALALRPSYAQAQIWLAYLLNGTGRHDEAIAEVQRARVLEPLSPMAATSLGIVLSGAGRTDAAIDAYRTSLELDSNYWLTHNWLGMAYRRKGLMQDAIAELLRAIDLSSRTPPVVARLGHIYAVAGRHAEALKTIDELIAASKQRWVSPVDIAQIYVALGRVDAAFDWLEEAVRLHDSKLRTIRASGEFAKLRSDARFAGVLQRAGLGR